mgnify:CR=1 FL=1
MFFPYTRNPDSSTKKNKVISFFDDLSNVDDRTVTSFGDEWNKFDRFSDHEILTTAKEYFDILPESINADSKVLDVGCGTGRWTKYLSARINCIDAIDPSAAIFAADRLLESRPNVRLTRCSVDNLPVPDNAYDLVMSIGVLHHVPDTRKALACCVAKAKKGGYVYVYLYYNLDNRGVVFKVAFFVSNVLRRLVSRLPKTSKHLVCDFLALLLYLPFISLARLFRFFGLIQLSEFLPLSSYQNKTWFVIRANALDPFGTPYRTTFFKKRSN